MTSLTIENGHTAYIKVLHQYATYAGLLEGLSTREMNREIIKDAVESAPDYTRQSAVYLIEPIEYPVEYDGVYPFGQPASIPPITCFMLLQCHQVFRDFDMHGSALTVVWFQENYAMPIDDLILEKIKQIPWAEIADEFEY